MPIFRVKSVKIYTGQKKFTRASLVGSWQIWGMGSIWSEKGLSIIRSQSAWHSLIEYWTWSQNDLSMIWPEGSMIRAWLRHEWYFTNNIYSWTHCHYFICTKCWPVQQSSEHLYFAFWRQSWIAPLGSSQDRAWRILNGQQYIAIDFVPFGGARWWASKIIWAAATNCATLSLSRKSLNLQFAAKTDFQHSNSSLAFQLLN